MAIEIVNFPLTNGGSFHSYVNVYQRVKRLKGLLDSLDIHIWIGIIFGEFRWENPTMFHR